MTSVLTDGKLCDKSISLVADASNKDCVGLDSVITSQNTTECSRADAITLEISITQHEHKAFVGW